MRDTKAFLTEIGFELTTLSRLETNGPFIEAYRPPGQSRFNYPPQIFRCESRELPVAILKLRPHKTKAVAVLVLLPDGTAWYRTGGIDLPTRAIFAELEIAIEKHIRLRGDAQQVA